MPFTGPSEDRQAIRELYDTYSGGASCMDRNAWLGCFTPDAVWKTHYFEVSGHDGIGAKHDELMVPVTAASFIAQVVSIEVEGDRAHGRAICVERLAMPGGSYRLTGRYEDEIVRHEGRWLFKHRDYHVIFEELPGVGE